MEAALADSARAGQEAAPPITAAPLWIEPLGGRFQTGFFTPAVASDDDDAAMSSGGGFWGNRSEDTTEGITAAGGGGGVKVGEVGTVAEVQGWRAARGERAPDKGSEPAALVEGKEAMS